MPKGSLNGLFEIADLFADKMASNIAARISKEHTLDDDLRSIFRLRILPVLRLFVSISITLQVRFPETFHKNFPLHDTEFLNTLNKIGKEEYGFFADDIRRYEGKNKELIVETKNKAKDHNRQSIAKRSIFKLIQWDKNFLSCDFIHSEIAVRQFLCDCAFYERLSDVIRKKSRIEKRAKERTWIGVFKFYLRAFVDFAGIERSDAIKILFKLSEFYYEKGIMPEALGSDYEYFRKYLRRHGVI